jgi:hypothetical protein
MIYGQLPLGVKRPTRSGSVGVASSLAAMLLKFRDGHICVTYGYRLRPCSIRGRLSRDHGKTRGDIVNSRDGGAARDLGYTRSVPRCDSKIVTAYYFNDAPITSDSSPLHLGPRAMISRAI